MLRIYPVCLEMVREVRPYADRIGRFDRDLARQLRRSCASVVLNVAEGWGQRDGRRRQSYQCALGEARETLANIEAAQAIGYITSVDAQLRQRLHHLRPLVSWERSVVQPPGRHRDRGVPSVQP